MLPYLLVDTGVIHPRVRAQVRFEGLYFVILVEPLYRVVGGRVFQIAENPRLGRTDFHASRVKAARDAMVAKRAFFGRLGYRVQEPAAIRTRLNAETAADAILRIDQHRAVRGVKRGPHRANLNTSRVLAQVAKLGHKEGVLNLFLGHRRFWESMHSP